MTATRRDRSVALSDPQRRVLAALKAAGATGEVLGQTKTGDVDRNHTTVGQMVERGLLPNRYVGRTLKALEDRGLIGGRTVLLNQDWGNWCVWWLTDEGREAVDA